DRPIDRHTGRQTGNGDGEGDAGDGQTGLDAFEAAGEMDAEAGGNDAGADDSMLAGQFSADLEYRRGLLFLGAGSRYQWTESADLGGNGQTVDNWLHQVKLGVNF
ncbi:MAG: hypothetical protein ABEJ96_10735, partial [Thiohalorhabdaceae bacterium]